MSKKRRTVRHLKESHSAFRRDSMSTAALRTFDDDAIAPHSAVAALPTFAVEPKLKTCVLAACPFPANHGTPGSIRELAEATAERGHEMHIVTYHFGDDLPLR